MKKAKFDFGGYATKVDLRCADGRTIKPNAFADQNGQVVPLVWQHMHNDPDNILGKVLLENRDDGVYAYGVFNDSDKGKKAAIAVEHGDITSLSIFANSLVQKGKDVIHGAIKEVSLVIAGANPGAIIDNLAIEHSDGSITTDSDEAIIHTGFDFDEVGLEVDLEDEPVSHADGGKNKTIQDVFDTLSDEQKEMVYVLVGQAAEDEPVSHADGGKNKTIQDVFDTLSDEQKEMVYVLVGQAAEEAKKSSESDKTTKPPLTKKESGNIKHSNGGERNMKTNIFDQATVKENEIVLSHDDVKMIVENAKRHGRLSHAVKDFIEHDNTYGVTNIDYLFPDAQEIFSSPEFLKRRTEWVDQVLSNAKHSPFARIKSTVADITADEARARGYVKGAVKKEEIINLLQRITIPATIYKKQKLDRDDVIDITTFDIVVWLKAEMKLMLEEELARAILVGDGRAAGTEGKIPPINVRPIWTDDDMYAHHIAIPAPAVDATTDDITVAKMEAIIRSREFYKGTGTPTFYTTAGFMSDMLLVKDKMGRPLYDSDQAVANKLRVSNIVEVEVMDGLSRVSGANNLDLIGIYVNISDYTIGADKGGEVNFFDDFDIDYNQLKYLIETHVSGALTRPKSAVVIEQIAAV